MTPTPLPLSQPPQFKLCKSDDDKMHLLRFYHQQNEKIAAQDLQQVFFLQDDKAIVAALKVESIAQPNSWFLRNVLVAKERRGEGLSKQLLSQTLKRLQYKPCFCLAYSHLQPLYSGLGFEPQDSDSAADIFQKRYRRYNKKAQREPSKAVVLMAIHHTL